MAGSSSEASRRSAADRLAAMFFSSVSTARATSLVSLLAYAGLLFAPPAFGLSAEHFGLHTALCAVPVLLTITVLLAFLLGRLIKHSREDTQAVGS